MQYSFSGTKEEVLDYIQDKVIEDEEETLAKRQNEADDRDRDIENDEI